MTLIISSPSDESPSAMTSSSSARRIPITPPVARPIARASVSLKRIVWPFREMRNTSSVPSVSRTSISSSSPRRLIAASPVRGESYSGSDVFFTIPLRVANSRNRPSS